MYEGSCDSVDEIRGTPAPVSGVIFAITFMVVLFLALNSMEDLRDINKLTGATNTLELMKTLISECEKTLPRNTRCEINITAIPASKNKE